MIITGLCSSLSDKVDQTPADIYKEQGQTAIIYCSHKIDSYDKILWYKQLNGQLQYLGYLNVNTGYPEDGLNVTIEGDGNKDKNSTLTIKSLSESSSAVYFCVNMLLLLFGLIGNHFNHPGITLLL
uniref:Ig-like domain-containing protein n=1 Tax=Acanthochromis polyacanthus TaxID=80966 RepID=A0A3Q1F3D6_9TELE